MIKRAPSVDLREVSKEELTKYKEQMNREFEKKKQSNRVIRVLSVTCALTLRRQLNLRIGTKPSIPLFNSSPFLSFRHSTEKCM
jgi:hypothetical protein